MIAARKEIDIDVEPSNEITEDAVQFGVTTAIGTNSCARGLRLERSATSHRWLFDLKPKF